MHGRVKVRRSEEQERLRNEKKSKAERELRFTLDKLLSDRKDGVMNLSKLNELTPVVETAPDMTSLWNYRRDIINSSLLRDECPKSEQSKLMNDELDLTTRCLKASPKSYAVWHHRSWVMMHHPSPNWHQEVEFCNFALKLDERNFHCWDYRRFVVLHGKIRTQSEMSYTDSCLESNFSNYSAWHYRSELLSTSDPVIESSLPVSPPPYVQSKNGFCSYTVEESLPADELELVHNAIFTDPKDQSPWFYYWWLLGRGIRKAYLREVFLSRSLGRLILIFTAAKPLSALKLLSVRIRVTPMSSTAVEPLELTVENVGGWKSVLSENVSAVWWLSIHPDSISPYAAPSIRSLFHSGPSRFDISVCIRNVENSKEPRVCFSPDCPPDHIFCLKCVLDFSQSESLTRVDLDPLRLLNPIISPTNEPEALLGELENIRDLLSMEPQNKWALLTLVDLLRFIHPPESKVEVNNAIDVLSVVDKERTVFYSDMKVSYAAQDILVQTFHEHSREISLKGIGIDRLPYLDWYALMTKIDLSCNRISRLPETIAYLVCLADLNLDDNQLSSLHGISRLPCLSLLSVQRNLLHDFPAIEELLRCPKLQNVYLHGNEVTKIADLTSLLAEHPGSKNKSHSFVVTYDK
ncbi:Geranylgeranyl transferase type-2 subunit alpha [Fasciolopsis buskii]|uniref:Geranylgeranyl transferase type-2 subunit alpha n=1 Tax=Fasciolopsis buskii TaxID=27845 RepID=A0A8E0VFL9_9TREM|nr:Geranylgeranyl transferase type-2 subunit alpha [Fasciolopsis buski]